MPLLAVGDQIHAELFDPGLRTRAKDLDHAADRHPRRRGDAKALRPHRHALVENLKLRAVGPTACRALDVDHGRAGRVEQVGAILRDDVSIAAQIVAAAGTAEHDAAGGDREVPVDVELARPELDGAAVAVGLERLRGGEIDRVLDVRRVVARQRIDVNHHGHVGGNRLLARAVADHREVRHAIAVGIGHVDQPARHAGLDPGAFDGRQRRRAVQRRQKRRQASTNRFVRASPGVPPRLSESIRRASIEAEVENHSRTGPPQ